MKIRKGFVSNSSTSSFFASLQKGHFDGVMEVIGPYFRACMEAIGYEDAVYDGGEVVSFATISTVDVAWYDNISVNYDGDIPMMPWGKEATIADAIMYFVKTSKELYGDDSIIIKTVGD